MAALATSAAAQVTAEQKCQAGKNDAAGKYAACVAKAEKTFILKGDAAKYATALGKCESKLNASWNNLESKAVAAGTVCPSTGDQSPVEDFVDACVQSVAVAVGGGALPVDVATCNAELATCQGDLAACESAPVVLKTGQTTAYGAGSDGDLELGRAHSFTDNGDGTITDNATGLMWEKKSDDGSIHDMDNAFAWSTGDNNMNGFMVSMFLAELNSGGGFAGYTDWRIPNVYELQSLVNFEVTFLAPTVFPEFNTSCTPSCTVTTCSCTRSSYYWSSTTYRDSPNSAWSVYFNGGHTVPSTKTDFYSVRAVRGGS